jgi:hypothetical protein
LTNIQIVAYQKVKTPVTSSACFSLTSIKAEYANKLLYITTLVFAKLSIISLLMMLSEGSLHRNLGLGLTGIIATWGAVSELVAAFQCGSVEPWRFLGLEHHCIDLVRTLMYIHFW